MSPRTLPDLEARIRAATDFDSNLVVVAGAGTGKTSLLVERVLNAVGSGRVKLEAVAAITFTEKAAGELRERIAAGLDRLRALASGELDPEPQHEADRAFAWLQENATNEGIAARALAAMEDLDRAAVGTIHGLCSQILRAHPIEAGVDPDFVVDSGEHAEVLRVEVWEAFLAQELGPAAAREPLWRKVLEQFDIGQLGRVAQDLADFGIPPELVQPPFELATPETLLGDEVQAAQKSVAALLERATGLTDKTLTYFVALRNALDLFVERGHTALVRSAAHAGLARVLKRSRPKVNKKLAGVSAQEFDEAAKCPRDLLRRLLGIDNDSLQRVLEAVGPYVAEFRESYLRAGFVSFDGLLVLARDLLRGRTAAREQLKRRFQMLLVDEFQDTDPLQHEIVLFLAEQEGGKAREALDAVVAPGRLFVVGDPKQSIYRFRGADYTSYRRAVAHIAGSGGARVDLSANFRGVRGVLEPVNALFTSPDGCWSRSDHQPQYEPIRIVRNQPTPGPRVEVWTVASEGTAASRRREEGRLIAAEIERLVQDEGQRYERITLLLRAFTNLQFYLRALRERGIPFVVDGGKEFLDRPEVTQLMATLRTLGQPSDAAALLAFLRSPAGGVPDDELAAFAAGDCRWDWRDPGEVPPACRRIAARLQLLTGLEREIRDLPADIAIHRVVERSLLLPLGAAAFEGAQRVANLRKLATAAGELARDGKLSLEEVVDALREGRLVDIKTDSPLADDAAEAVRITSIHRMKGLENDRIFVADLARAEPSAGFRAPVVELARTRGGVELALNVDGIRNAASAWADRENALHERAEETRVLYVALTRAREHLVLLAGQAKTKAAWVEALAPWGYHVDTAPEDRAMLLVGTVLHRAPGATPDPAPHEVESSPELQRAVADYEGALAQARQLATPLWMTPSELSTRTAMGASAASEEYEEYEAGGENDAPRADPRAVGIVLHRWLERGEQGDWTTPGQELERLILQVGAETGTDAHALNDEVRPIVEAFVRSPLPALLQSVEVLGREIPLLSRRSDGRIYRGEVDLVYREEGEVVVADYKTDLGLDESEFAGRYHASMTAYATGVQRALGLESAPRTEIWALRSGERFLVSPAGRAGDEPDASGRKHV